MSTNLYWRKVNPKRPNSLGDGLKWVIHRKYGYDKAILRGSDLPFLEGVQATQEKDTEIFRDCETLMEAIRESDCGVEVWIAE